MDTPQPDPIGGRGGSTSDGGRAGRAGSSNAGASGSGRAGSTDDAGPSGSGSGGSGDDEPDAGSVVTAEPRHYCDAVSLVFTPTCGNGSCHTNRGARIGDFGAGFEEAASYVGRGSVRNPDCGLIINPIHPEESLILTKVTGDYPQDMGCGGPMPVGSFEITDAQIDCIASWVEQFRDE